MDRYEASSTLAGVIYISRLSDKRFSGIAARNFKMFRELCGDKTLRNVIFVTNMWGKFRRMLGKHASWSSLPTSSSRFWIKVPSSSVIITPSNPPTISSDSSWRTNPPRKLGFTFHFKGFGDYIRPTLSLMV